MLSCVSSSVPRVGSTATLYWQVSAYNAFGDVQARSIHRSLTAAYRQRAYLLKLYSVVVVEVVS